MAFSKRGIFDAPKKSPYNFERYDSDLERLMMEKLEADPEVTRWMKRHSISIDWIDQHNRMCKYIPDFLVQYQDGSKAIIEVKNPVLIETDAVKRKRVAAEAWCQKRGMRYQMKTIN